MRESLKNPVENGEGISRSKRLWMAVVLGSLAAFGPLSIDMYLPAFPDLARDFHTSPTLLFNLV